MRCSRLLVRELPVLLIIAFAAAACSDATVLGVDDESRPEFASTLTRGGPVLCPTARTRTASAVIGRRGGTVALDGHRVTLPPGAVRRPTKITLTAPASRYLEIDLRANDQDHYEFDRPVEVAISYARCKRADLQVRPLNAWYIDPATKAHVETMPGKDDKANRIVTFATSHFSFYAIAD